MDTLTVFVLSSILGFIAGCLSVITFYCLSKILFREKIFKIVLTPKDKEFFSDCFNKNNGH